MSLKQVEDKDEKPFNFRQNYDEMVTSFGSEKAKKELSARKRNTIESSALDVAMATAISHAEEEMKEGEGWPTTTPFPSHRPHLHGSFLNTLLQYSHRARRHLSFLHVTTLLLLLTRFTVWTLVSASLWVCTRFPQIDYTSK